ncbi:MAG: DUF3110 domain-containing protein [Cyanobacteria bacterium P01_A01_bin.123]
MQVFVVLFNANSDNAGIHTLKMGDRNVVLMFENEDDAIRYGLMLEAQDLPNPSVEPIDSDEIEEFCQGAGYDCALVEEGMLAMPPETNVADPDWDPDAKPEASFPSGGEDAATAMSDAEMDKIRQRLEGLL